MIMDSAEFRTYLLTELESAIDLRESFRGAKEPTPELLALGALRQAVMLADTAVEWAAIATALATLDVSWEVAKGLD